MSDLISRKALYQEIARLEELARGRVLDTPTSSPFYDRYLAQLNERTSLKHLIADFPVAQGIDKWIPVSERLPKEGRYLVTTVYGEVKESEFDLKKWWQIDNSTISLEWEEEPIKVVAWQPLPDPWKGEVE